MSSRTAADVAILSAAIRTLDPDRPEATGVAFRDGTIAVVGSDAEVREVCDSSTELIDGSDMAVVPGIVDAHIHPFWADHVLGADLTRCGTLAELHEALADERSRVGDGWVRGWGVDYGIFSDTGIDGRVLEPAVGGGPALVTFMDFHTGLATPRALELAGVTGPVEFAEGAEIVVRDGRPTGELREGAAVDLVRDVIPTPTAAELRAVVKRTQKVLNSVGVTGVHAMDGSPQTFEILRELEGAGDLTVRAVIPFWQHPDTPFEEMERQLGLGGSMGDCGVGASRSSSSTASSTQVLAGSMNRTPRAPAPNLSGPIPIATPAPCSCSLRPAFSASLTRPETGAYVQH